MGRVLEWGEHHRPRISKMFGSVYLLSCCLALVGFTLGLELQPTEWVWDTNNYLNNFRKLNLQGWSVPKTVATGKVPDVCLALNDGNFSHSRQSVSCVDPSLHGPLRQTSLTVSSPDLWPRQGGTATGQYPVDGMRMSSMRSHLQSNQVLSPVVGRICDSLE